MKRLIKAILLSVASILLLTGCTGFFGPTKKDGASADNLDDEVIISQVKEQLKKNMTNLGFDVNVDDYSYKVQASSQTGSTIGTVGMVKKNYESYGNIIVYSGKLGSKKKNETIKFENVENNPVVFVANGYQEYVIKHIFNNKELKNSLEIAKQKMRGEILPYSPNYLHKYEGQQEESYNPEESVNQKFITKTTFLNSTIKIKKEDYFNLFKGKSVQDFDYDTLRKEMKYVVNVGLYIDVADKEIIKLQEQVREYYNKETMVITVTNYKER